MVDTSGHVERWTHTHFEMWISDLKKYFRCVHPAPLVQAVLLLVLGLLIWDLRGAQIFATAENCKNCSDTPGCACAFHEQLQDFAEMHICNVRKFALLPRTLRFFAMVQKST